MVKFIFSTKENFLDKVKDMNDLAALKINAD